MRPYFGIVLQTVSPAVASRYGLAVQSGALLIQVSPGSPAAQAGLQQSDVIVAINDKPVNSASDLATEIQNTQIGQRVKIAYYRGSNKADTSVVPVQRP